MARKNQMVPKSQKEEKEEMKVEFTVSTEGKEQDPKLQELQKRRATYRANLSYAVQMQDKYAAEYTEALQAEADKLTVDKLELKLAEQKLRIEFYRDKIAKVEEEIARYKMERKKEHALGKEENESAA
ncbi:MAG: hypothetical protein ACOYIJ_00015 [Eubacteriales bacterium]|jgi:hypothetical protein